MRLTALLTLLWLAAAPARADQGMNGRFGAGLIGGSPSGGTIKYWFSDLAAADFGIGYSDAFVVYWDFILNDWNLLKPKTPGARVNVYLGAGPRLAVDDGAKASIRIMTGLGYWPAKKPLEIFFEVGPVAKLAPNTGLDVDGGVGFRWYFRTFRLYR